MRGIEDEITLSTLFPGHDRYINDAGLALAKREMAKADVLTPHQVLQAVQRSTACLNTPVPASRMVWYDWKAFLSQFSDKHVPSAACNFFKFQKACPGAVLCQEVSNSSEVKEFYLLCDGVSVATVRSERCPVASFGSTAAQQVTLRGLRCLLCVRINFATLPEPPRQLPQHPL